MESLISGNVTLANGLLTITDKGQTYVLFHKDGTPAMTVADVDHAIDAAVAEAAIDDGIIKKPMIGAAQRSMLTSQLVVTKADIPVRELDIESDPTAGVVEASTIVDKVKLNNSIQQGDDTSKDTNEKFEALMKLRPQIDVKTFWTHDETVEFVRKAYEAGIQAIIKPLTIEGDDNKSK